MDLAGRFGVGCCPFRKLHKGVDHGFKTEVPPFFMCGGRLSFVGSAVIGPQHFRLLVVKFIRA